MAKTPKVDFTSFTPEISVPDASETKEPTIGIKLPAASFTERNAKESVTEDTVVWKYRTAHITPQLIVIIFVAMPDMNSDIAPSETPEI